MHVFRSGQPELPYQGRGSAAGTGERKRPGTAEGSGVARCPRCRAVLVAVSRARPGFFCRCLARLPIPA